MSDIRSITDFTVGSIESFFEGMSLVQTLEQDGIDLHGGHPLFYWQRARGRGRLVSAGPAAVVSAVREDVRKITLIRPVGASTHIVPLVCQLASELGSYSEYPVVVRYCGQQLCDQLRENGWREVSSPWDEYSTADDESFPQIIAGIPATNIPEGIDYKRMRSAERRFRESMSYSASDSLMFGDEREWCLLEERARQRGCWTQISDFLNVTFDACEQGLPLVTYHYLHEGTNIVGFAVTGLHRQMSHGLLLIVAAVDNLAYYFLWKIMEQQSRSGATQLNCGGSEYAGLSRFKGRLGHTRSVPTYMLEWGGGGNVSNSISAWGEASVS